MSQILKAVDDIKSLASRFRGFLEVAETLEKIGNLQQLESEATDKTARAQKDAAAADATIEQKKGIVSKLDEEIEYARKSAEEIIANAKQRAMTIVDEAGVQGNELLRVVSAKKAAFESELGALRDKMGFVEGAIKEKEAILAGVLSKIDEAKERVSSLFK